METPGLEEHLKKEKEDPPNSLEEGGEHRDSSEEESFRPADTTKKGSDWKKSVRTTDGIEEGGGPSQARRQATLAGSDTSRRGDATPLEEGGVPPPPHQMSSTTKKIAEGRAADVKGCSGPPRSSLPIVICIDTSFYVAWMCMSFMHESRVFNKVLTENPREQGDMLVWMSFLTHRLTGVMMRLTESLFLDQLVCPSSSRVHPNLDQGTWIKCPQGILDHEPASWCKTPDSSIPDPASTMAQGPPTQELEKKLVARVRDLSHESQIRLEHYLAHFHASLDHEVELHIHLLDEPEMKPAVMSLRRWGRIQDSEAIPLRDLKEALGMTTEENEMGHEEEETTLGVLQVSTTTSEDEQPHDTPGGGSKESNPSTTARSGTAESDRGGAA